MARILTVISERKKVRDNYRKHLEDEYVEEQRQHLMSKVEELKGTEQYELEMNENIKVPKIDQ